MDIVIRKIYLDYEKEEAWLNAMSGDGYALKSYTWCKYVFEHCKQGEYIHRLELLENWAGHPKSVEYIEFMKETGAEHISSYMRWVYFRKRAEHGKFDIYSDIDSKIKHYTRIITFFTPVMILNLVPAVINTFNAILISPIHGYGSLSMLLLSILNMILAICIGSVIIKYRHKVKLLRADKLLKA